MKKIEKLRPHHLLCERFLKLDMLDRGKEFEQFAAVINELLVSDSNDTIEIIEGVDVLCHVCPDCRNDRCESPHGDEDAVKKFDKAILRGLGVSYGEKKSMKDIREIISQKAPLDFCRTHCPWRKKCTIFEPGWN